MAKEKTGSSAESSHEGRLKKDHIVYDGQNCQIMTTYPAGTPISKIQDGHRHLIKETDLE
jgi:hypothetical protein